MIELSNEEIRKYLNKSYSAVDGLWFMKVEEEYGFEKALDIDRKVWMVMPKIQSRFLKARLKKENGSAPLESEPLESLNKCFSKKLELDGFEFKSELSGNKKSLTFNISKCPWFDEMVDSGREHLADRVGSVICKNEYGVWASEFGKSIKLEFRERLCGKCRNCIFTFYIK